VLDRIVEGKLDKFYSEACLLEQEFIKDPDRNIGDMVKEFSGTVGEPVVVRRFIRFELGEDI
jgi:elongation factor Ts